MGLRGPQRLELHCKLVELGFQLRVTIQESPPLSGSFLLRVRKQLLHTLQFALSLLDGLVGNIGMLRHDARVRNLCLLSHSLRLLLGCLSLLLRSISLMQRLIHQDRSMQLGLGDSSFSLCPDLFIR